MHVGPPTWSARAATSLDRHPAGVAVLNASADERLLRIRRAGCAACCRAGQHTLISSNGGPGRHAGGCSQRSRWRLARCAMLDNLRVWVGTLNSGRLFRYARTVAGLAGKKRSAAAGAGNLYDIVAATDRVIFSASAARTDRDVITS